MKILPLVLRQALCLLAGFHASALLLHAAEKPNIILVMSDDQGWGDVAYNGNKTVKTPHLDTMAREGVRLDRFYAAAPVCSPTRGSCLTGRHPFRYGIEWAGENGLPKEELTLAETLRTSGYATGHFGKWHIGQMSKTVKQTYFPGDKANPKHYSPPWENGYDVTFATAASVPTYNPYFHDSPELGQPGYKFIMDKPVTHGSTDGLRVRENYWTGPGQFVDENLAGEDSKILMNKALQFIRKNTKTKKPFFTTIWFHSPHTPIVAGDEMRSLYPNESIERQHWFGCLSAIDVEMGRLRATLKKLGIADNTIVWFCSDNGPSYIHNHNSAGPFRGKKATLWEGGIRVPAIVEWPAEIKGQRILNAPMSTSDFYPTLLAAAGVVIPEDQPVLDGENVLPILTGKKNKRGSTIAFQAPVMNDKNVHAKKGSLQMCLQGDQYKLISFDAGTSWQLYNLLADKEEQHDIATQHPEVVKKMATTLKSWRKSCSKSARGKDYPKVSTDETPLPGAIDVFIAGSTELEGVPDSKTRYGQFREPGVVVTNSGRVVVVTQARDHSKWSDRSGQDLAVKWSDDHGVTWSEAVMAADHGNHSICPQSVVYDKEKDTLHVLYSVHHWDFTIGHSGYKKLKKSGEIVRENARQYHIQSDDGGKTWTRPRDISDMMQSDKAVVVFGSGRGIQLQHGKHKGRLVISGGTRVPRWGNNAFYSDDHGKTWKVSSYVPKPSGKKISARNEAKIAELPDGTLIMHCRAMPTRVKACSIDGGTTWQPYQWEKGIQMASCNGALISHTDKKSGKHYLVAAGPAGPGRKNGMVWISEDGGKTWPHRKLIIPRTIAYSSLATLTDGTIALVYESEVYHGGTYKHIRMKKFRTSDIIGHNDPMPKDKSDPNEGTYINP